MPLLGQRRAGGIFDWTERTAGFEQPTWIPLPICVRSSNQKGNERDTPLVAWINPRIS